MSIKSLQRNQIASIRTAVTKTLAFIPFIIMLIIAGIGEFFLGLARRWEVMQKTIKSYALTFFSVLAVVALICFEIGDIFAYCMAGH